MTIQLEFKKEDLWVGVFWKWTRMIEGIDLMSISLMRDGAASLGGRVRKSHYVLDIWICLIPMFPIHITWDQWPEVEL